MVVISRTHSPSLLKHVFFISILKVTPNTHPSNIGVLSRLGTKLGMSTLLQIALKFIQVKHTAMFSPISMGFHSKSHVTIPFY